MVLNNVHQSPVETFYRVSGMCKFVLEDDHKNIVKYLEINRARKADVGQKLPLSCLKFSQLWLKTSPIMSHGKVFT